MIADCKLEWYTAVIVDCKLEWYTAVIADSTCANSELYSCSVSRSCLFSISKSWACISFWWCITPCLSTGMGSGGEKGEREGWGGRKDEWREGEEWRADWGGGREENREPPQSKVYAPSWPQRLTWNLNNFLVGAEESSLRQLAPSWQCVHLTLKRLEQGCHSATNFL